jgi:hypothetical protein
MLLLVLDPAQQRDLVTQLGGLFEIRAWPPFHLGVELVAQRWLRPSRNITEWRTSSAYSSAPPADTRRLAALDLVLQAGPGAVGVVAVLALAHEKAFCNRLRLSRIAPALG